MTWMMVKRLDHRHGTSIGVLAGKHQLQTLNHLGWYIVNHTQHILYSVTITHFRHGRPNR